VRDFILGVRIVDGMGRLLRMGGKVVKNAAGFDLPKFFVGSLGRFGVLAEITFKVFPRPEDQRTVRLAAKTLDSAVELLTEAANSRYEFDALDIPPGGPSVLARLTGPPSAVDALEREVLTRWPGEPLSADDANIAWASLNEFTWVDPSAALVKVALSPATVIALAQQLQTFTKMQMHFSAGGNVAFVSLNDATHVSAFDACLQGLALSGMTLRGEAPLWFGARSRPAILDRVKRALDEPGRFPALDE
jgi:glycolate oxidase FAD binding subunit